VWFCLVLGGRALSLDAGQVYITTALAMPYRLIGANIKQQALWLLAEGYLPDEVHVILDVSNRSMQRWTANLAGYGHVIPPHNPLQG
jgi:hypothetical protein